MCLNALTSLALLYKTPALLLITWRGYTFNQVTESPHIFLHNGLWYLVISTSSGQPLTLYTATDPLAPFAISV